jgi:hypothetical protein
MIELEVLVTANGLFLEPVKAEVMVRYVLQLLTTGFLTNAQWLGTQAYVSHYLRTDAVWQLTIYRYI